MAAAAAAGAFSPLQHLAPARLLDSHRDFRLRWRNQLFGHQLCIHCKLQIENNTELS